jgi:transcriptional regulator with XRE-family HTH domain
MGKVTRASQKRKLPRRTAETIAIGQRARTVRQESGRTVACVAKKARISKNHLYVLERGEALPTVPTLGRLAAALGVTREWLMGVAGARKQRNGTVRKNGNGGSAK